MEILQHPSDTALLERYGDIEKIAMKALFAGEVGGNPLLKSKFRGNPWSISTQGFLYNSSAGNFLMQASHRLQDADTGLAVTAPEDQHISFTEVAFNQVSRKVAGITPLDVRSYCFALMTHFIQDLAPVKLRLVRLLPALDPQQPNSQKRTVSVVGGFITGDDEIVYEIRERIQEAVRVYGLELGSIYGGPPKVLFATLGRFIEPPIMESGSTKVITVLDDLNEQLDNSKEPLVTNITEINVICTSPLDYKSPRGHISFLRLFLQKMGNKRGEFYLLRPNQRRERTLRGPNTTI